MKPATDESQPIATSAMSKDLRDAASLRPELVDTVRCSIGKAMGFLTKYEHVANKPSAMVVKALEYAVKKMMRDIADSCEHLRCPERFIVTYCYK